MTREIDIIRDQDRLRREALIRRVLDTLRSTVQLHGMTPETPVDDVRVEFTDASARVVAPLVEAVAILEAIIFASDGCMGHRNCQHSMEPWQRARELLNGIWQAEVYRREWPTSALAAARSSDGGDPPHEPTR